MPKTVEVSQEAHNLFVRFALNGTLGDLAVYEPGLKELYDARLVTHVGNNDYSLCSEPVTVVGANGDSVRVNQLHLRPASELKGGWTDPKVIEADREAWTNDQNRIRSDPTGYERW